jgi:hypothetical protein
MINIAIPAAIECDLNGRRICGNIRWRACGFVSGTT